MRAFWFALQQLHEVRTSVTVLLLQLQSLTSSRCAIMPVQPPIDSVICIGNNRKLFDPVFHLVTPRASVPDDEDSLLEKTGVEVGSMTCISRNVFVLVLSIQSFGYCSLGCKRCMCLPLPRSSGDQIPVKLLLHSQALLSQHMFSPRSLVVNQMWYVMFCCTYASSTDARSYQQPCWNTVRLVAIWSCKLLFNWSIRWRI